MTDLVAPRSLDDARGPGALETALARLETVEDRVHAWVAVAPSPGGAGPLAGVPVGIKDIVDVAGVPTRCGSAARSGVGPAVQDATIVTRLRRAGAAIVGKTVTTEFAFFDPGPTSNPHDLARTPGGSSSGSAAAVAAGVVPLAVGTQTAGSVVRPASFCGVAGYALPRGTVPYDGIAVLAASLDTVGLFAATVADLAVARAALDGRAPAPAGSRPLRLLAWDGTAVADVEPAMRAALAEAVGRVRADGGDVADLPVDVTATAVDQRAVMAAEAARTIPAALAAVGAGEHLLGPHIAAFVAEGRTVAPDTLTAAVDRAATTRATLLAALDEADAVLAPGALGVAPTGLASTGDPAMSRPWHLLGLPALAVPGLSDPAGLPLGLQLLGHPDREDALLAAGRRLEALLRA
jgi:Asp-tRNA(Asn)/Glu-tRNA(Gln) amidotransferase A subunit family amidase